MKINVKEWKDEQRQYEAIVKWRNDTLAWYYPTPHAVPSNHHTPEFVKVAKRKVSQSLKSSYRRLIKQEMQNG